jgi:putative glutamine amidotransferase
VRPRIGISANTRVIDGPIGPVLMHTSTRFYVDAVRATGALPVILPVLDEADVAELLEVVDGVVITGGADVDPTRYGQPAAPETSDPDPARDAFDIRLVRDALDGHVPILATCRGMQVVNVALGGTLVQHIPDHRCGDRWDEGVHPVKVEPDSRLASLLGTTELDVNSVHHQAVDRVAPGLRVVARAGDGTVEAIEPAEDVAPLVAVQWHPELLAGWPSQRRLFEALVARATSRDR